MAKKILHIYFFIAGIFSCLFSNAQDSQNDISSGPAVFYYENGKISSQGFMRNGRPDGYWKTYSLNGKIKSEGNRKNYLLDSVWKFYNEKGKILNEINYLEGKKNGIKIIWEEGKHIFSEEKFEADLKQGTSFYYYLPDDTNQVKGKLKLKIDFDKGKENGMAYEYDKNGNIITLFEYNHGVLKKQEKINRADKQGQKQGVWKEFYADGKVKSETTFQNGKKTGYMKTFSEKGSLLDIQKYKGDSIEKKVPELTTNLEVRNEYYEDGSIKRTGTYLFGVEEGVHKEYSPEGKITWAKIYKEGNLIGEGKIDEAGNQQGNWVEYHANGKIKAKGNYENGIKTAEWIFYHPNEKIEQKGKYDKKGKAQGTWKWFYESGNLLRQENYVNGKREDTLTEWNDSGKVITKGIYIDGMKEGYWFYELKNYREEGNYKNDQKDGLWKSYYADNNQLQFEGSYVEGLQNGKQVYYFHDGKIQEEGKYIVGNKDGKWSYYNPDGTILITITYNNGKEIKFDGTKVKPFVGGE